METEGMARVDVSVKRILVFILAAAIPAAALVPLGIWESDLYQLIGQLLDPANHWLLQFHLYPLAIVVLYFLRAFALPMAVTASLAFVTGFVSPLATNRSRALALAFPSFALLVLYYVVRLLVNPPPSSGGEIFPPELFNPFIALCCDMPLCILVLLATAISCQWGTRARIRFTRAQA